MAVRTDKNVVAIIDLRIFQITQMLTFIEKFGKYFLKFKYSIYDRALYLLGANSDWSGIYDSERGEFILKFCFWQRMSLQELCLSEIVNYFGVSEIKSFSLPQFLIEEVSSFKLYSYNCLVLQFINVFRCVNVFSCIGWMSTAFVLLCLFE